MHPAKRLLLEISRITSSQVEKTGDVDVRVVAAILESALRESPRVPLVLGLSAYLVAALDGAIPDLETWEP